MAGMALRSEVRKRQLPGEALVPGTRTVALLSFQDKTPFSSSTFYLYVVWGWEPYFFCSVLRLGERLG